MHWCQLVHTEIPEREIPDINLMHDDSPCPDLHVAACSVYVDNGVVLELTAPPSIRCVTGLGLQFVSSVWRRTRTTMMSLGLTCWDFRNLGRGLLA